MHIGLFYPEDSKRQQKQRQTTFKLIGFSDLEQSKEKGCMNKIEVLLLDMAREFLSEMPRKAGVKMISVLDQVREGNRDSRL